MISGSKGVKFGPFELHPEEKLLLRDRQIVILAPKTLAMLTVLVEEVGNVVPRSELIERVWPDSYIEEGNLTQHIFVLRKLLSPAFPDAQPILTIPKRGYRFNLPVEPCASPASGDSASVPDPGAELSAPPTEASSPGGLESDISVAVEGPPRRNRRPWASAGIAAAVLCLAPAFVLAHREQPKPPAPTAGLRSIAVLPYENLSGASSDRWISTAVFEMLSTELGAAPGVAVAPLESVEQAQREIDLPHSSNLSPGQARAFARDVHCDVLVTGAFLVSGGSLRIDTHWVDGHSGATLGTATQTRKLDEILPLIADTADRIHRELKLASISPADSTALLIVANPAASRLYWEAEERNSLWDSGQALELYQKAAALDAQSPMIAIGMAKAYSVLGRETLAAEQASHAEKLASRLPREQALQVQADAETVRGDQRQAASTFRLLAALRPADAEYQRQLIAALSKSGQVTEALAAVTDAQKQFGTQDEDPRFDSTVSDTYSTMGNWPQSLIWAQKGIQEARRRGALILCGRLLTSASQAELYLKLYAKAGDDTREALAIAKRFDDYSGELRALNRLGQIDIAKGDSVPAEEELNEALRLEDALGERQRKIHTLGALGDLALQAGQPRDALSDYKQQLAEASEFGQPDFIALAKFNIAKAEMKMGDRVSAEAGMHAAVDLARAAGDHYIEDLALQAIAGLRK